MCAITALSAEAHQPVSGASSARFLPSSRRRPGRLALSNSILIAFVLLGASPRVEAQGIPAQARITAPLDEAVMARLAGNTHPLARPEFDQGAVADSQPLRRVFLLLKRSTDQESALRTLMDEQQSKSSANYHRWLTPQQFGQQFGPADADVRTVTGWLQSHGLQVSRVSAGKTVIEFSGNAGQMRQAFHTQIHRYVVNSQEHFANSSDPQIPAALTPVVVGTVSLHNFPRKPQSHVAGSFSRNKSTGIVKPLKSPAQLRNGNAAGPDFTFSSLACPINNTCYALGPADFATIYNISPSMTGTGQTIAIVGDSEICTFNSPDFGNCGSDDVATFRRLFNLPLNYPNVIVDGADPGFNGDETEGDLDVEWAGAIAQNATIDYVIAQDTEANSGVDLAAEYVVDNNLAPILNESFGLCEQFLGGINQFYSSLWEQAAAQGITVVVASGDSGSAGCDFPGPFASQAGLAVNGIASTPFNVAAGGTDFDVTAANYASTYWNNNTTGGSAKSYIPETTWNDSCAQNFTGSLAACNSPLLTGLNVVGGGGGESSCAIQSGFSCTGGYAKPAWQSGPYVTGMASTDGVRDLPDISFFAADGSVSGSFYIVCEADLDPQDAQCSLSTPSNFTTFIGVGGTSSAAPAFAGVMALVNQHEVSMGGPTRQGNANFVLYALANAQQKANLNCNSARGPVSGCTFNDVTRGNNSVPCYLGTTNCNAVTPTPYGLLEPADSSGNLLGTIAYNTGAGYDLATGLGTINVTNLVNNWQSVVGSFQPTTTTLSICAPPATPCTSTALIAISHGQTVDFTAKVTSTSGGTPTGDVTLIDSVTQNVIGLFTLSGGSVSTQLLSSLPGGMYTVTAHYGGDGIFGASDSTPPLAVIVNPENSTTTLTAPVLNLANGNIMTLRFPNGGTIDFGDVVYLRADVAGTASGLGKATGTVTFTDTTTSTTLGTVQLNAESYAELQMGATVFGAPLNSLALGSHHITANYNGDASYNASASSVLPLTVSAAPTTITVQASSKNIPPSSSITVSPGTQITLTAFIDTQNTGNPSGGSFANSAMGTEPQGTVTFTVGSNSLVPVAVGAGNTTVDGLGFVAASVSTNYAPMAAGNLTVNATFTPSSSPNYAGSSTTSAATVNVGNTEGFTLTPSTPPNCSNGPAGNCIFIPSVGKSATSPVTVTSIGLNGTVALTCVVTPTNPADLQMPGCSFTLNGAANSTVSLNVNGSSGTRMLTITTTAASVLAPSARLPQGPAPYWILATGTLSAAGFLLLLLNVRARRPRLAAVFGFLLVIFAGAAVGCGGGGSSGSTSSTTSSPTGGSGSGSNGGGSGSGNTSQPGTTADIYTVTVTATPSAGTSIQTQFMVFVQ
jgi:subtilase family serine protease